MVARTTDEILQEIDRTGGGPVQFEDPRTHLRYVVLPQAEFQRVSGFLQPVSLHHDESADWDEVKNERRWQLVAKEIANELSIEEAVELRSLQRQFLAYRQRVAPIPLEGAQRLHDELLRKAASAAGNR
jgi:hypothetical protein